MQDGPIVDSKPNTSLFRKLIRILAWFTAGFCLLLIAGFILVMVYEKEVKEIAVKELNKHLNTEVRIDPANIDLTFISSFPRCAISFHQITAMESWKKKKRDTLFHASSIALEFNIKDLFNKHYNIKKISVSDGFIDLKCDKQGRINYLFLKDKGKDTVQTSDSLRFALEDLHFKNITLKYRDKKNEVSTSMLVEDLQLKGDFQEKQYEMQSSGKLRLHTLSSGEKSLLKNKNITLDVSLKVDDKKYVLENSSLHINRMLLQLNGDFLYGDSLQRLDVKYIANELDIASVLSLLPEKYQNRISDYKSSGRFYANGSVQYKSGQDLQTRSEFGISNADVLYKPNNITLEKVSLSGALILDKNSSSLTLEKIHARLKSHDFSGRFAMRNFEDPDLEIEASGSFDLADLNSFWPIDTLEKIEGKAVFQSRIKGHLKDIKDQTLSEKTSIHLDAQLNDLHAVFKNDRKDLNVESCHIIAQERDVKVEHLKLKKGESDLDVSGEIPGLFNYVLDQHAPLIIKGNLNSGNLNIEDLIFPGGTNSELNIPENLQLDLNANIGHFKFNHFEAKSISGNFELNKQKAMVSDMMMETMQGKAYIDAFADASGKNLQVTLESRIDHVNVNQLFFQLNNFGQTTLIDKNVKGFLTATINFSGNWDKHLNADLGSIRSGARILIDKGELNDFKPLESLSKFVDLKDLKNIRFASLTSDIEIHDKTIFIPQTNIKNSALNIDFSGKHDFDNNIDYHVRLLISELLAKKRNNQEDEFGPVENDPENRRSAFILMTGNIDNIVMKYDRKGMRQKVKEDIKQEKETLKQILKEEFGLFKKDSIKVKAVNKSDQKFELEKSDNKPPKKTLEPKKKSDDDDDF